MADISNIDIDRVLHQPVRTRIVAYLVARGEVTFTDLKKALEITDGNLEAHLKKLIAVEYINTHKESGPGRPQTLYRLTPKGEEAFKDYVNNLDLLLNIKK